MPNRKLSGNFPIQARSVSRSRLEGPECAMVSNPIARCRDGQSLKDVSPRRASVKRAPFKRHRSKYDRTNTASERFALLKLTKVRVSSEKTAPDRSAPEKLAPEMSTRLHHRCSTGLSVFGGSTTSIAYIAAPRKSTPAKLT